MSGHNGKNGQNGQNGQSSRDGQTGHHARKDSDLALLADLVDGIEPTDPRFARSEALLADDASRAELDEHRRLIALLKEHEPPADHPNWHALEASIRRACEAEAPAPNSWRSWLRAWRWPALALGVATAALAVALLRTETPSAKAPEVAAGDAPPRAPLVSAAPDAPKVIAAPDVITAWAELPDEPGWLDEALDETEELSEAAEEPLAPPGSLPRAAAITLGLAEGEPPREESADGSADTAEPGELWLEELHQLDGESLRRLDAWLDAAKQKG